MGWAPRPGTAPTLTTAAPQSASNRVQRAAGPTLDRSSTTTPANSPVEDAVDAEGGMAGGVGVVTERRRSEVLRQTEFAAGDDVLLNLRGAAADGVDHRVAIGRLGPALHRGILGPDPKLASRSGQVHRRVGQPP